MKTDLYTVGKIGIILTIFLTVVIIVLNQKVSAEEINTENIIKSFTENIGLVINNGTEVWKNNTVDQELELIKESVLE